METESTEEQKSQKKETKVAFTYKQQRCLQKDYRHT